MGLRNGSGFRVSGLGCDVWGRDREGSWWRLRFELLDLGLRAVVGV